MYIRSTFFNSWSPTGWRKKRVIDTDTKNEKSESVEYIFHFVFFAVISKITIFASTETASRVISAPEKISGAVGSTTVTSLERLENLFEESMM